MHLNLEVAAVICIEVGGARNYNPLHRVMERAPPLLPLGRIDLGRNKAG